VNFILFDAALELVPHEISSHPAILADSSRWDRPPEQLVLDRAVHHFSMLDLDDSERRGRPDISHMTLLMVTDSPAYRKGKVRIYVHTVRDTVLKFHGVVRLPPNYHNFVNLMSQLLTSGRVPLFREPLIKTYRSSLGDLLKTLGGYSLLMTSRGRRADITEALQGVTDDVNVLVGGYPRGAPREDLVELCNDKLSICDQVLASWTVASRILYDLERGFLKL